METLRANIFKGDELLFENILVHIRLIEAPGLPEWGGRFEISSLNFIPPNVIYRIILEDGRSGEIIFNEIKFLQEPALIWFRSAGPLK